MTIVVIVFRQVDKDCEFLEQERIMDYSLLVGIHFREASVAGELIPSGARTPIGSYSYKTQYHFSSAECNNQIFHEKLSPIAIKHIFCSTNSTQWIFFPK